MDRTQQKVLTISSTLLGFQTDSKSTAGVSKGKYTIGFICTILASAGYGLTLSLTQLYFQKVLKNQTFSAAMSMIICQSMVAMCVITMGLFAGGEWNDLTGEMQEFKTGKVSYLMILIWAAIIWQVYVVGLLGLIFEVSALFSNSISVLGLPIVPILAVVFFHDKMDGIKAMSMVLAIWGFVSYAYQQYLDDQKSATHKNNATEASATAKN